MADPKDIRRTSIPFNPVGSYEDYELRGRFVPRTDDGKHSEYELEVRKGDMIKYHAVVYIDPVDLEPYEPEVRVDKMREDAVSYARELIDSGAQPSQDPYRREASLLA